MVINAANQNLGGKRGSKTDTSLLPNSIEAEQAVLGAILVDPESERWPNVAIEGSPKFSRQS